jgi:hypothetical protein
MQSSELPQGEGVIGSVCSNSRCVASWKEENYGKIAALDEAPRSH